MSTIITRSTGSNPKGAPLTAGELDANFINLNADKVESTRAINTTAGDLTGGGDLSGDRTLGLASTGISAGTVQNSATQVTPLTLDIKGRVTAVGTPVTIAPDFSNVANKPTTLAGYGITDAQATITGAASTIDTEDLTASKVLVSNASGKVAASDISTTTLGYLDATSSVQGQLDSKQATTAKNAANGYAGLDANAKLPTSLLPALAISEYLGSVANQAARLALTGEKGDWCSQTNDGKVYVITGDDPTDNASWTALTYPVTPGITLNGTSIAPGDTATISAATTNTLTIGTGLSGTSFNGSAATTIAIDSSVVTLTGTQTLTNKALTSPTISGGTANNVAIGGTTPAAGAFTTLSASSTVSGTGFSTYLASPPAIGGTAPAAGAFTTLSASSTVSGTGFSTYLASPPAIGGTTPAAGNFTTLGSTGNTTLGNAAGDTLTINGTAVSAPNGLRFENGASVTNVFIGNGASAADSKLTLNGGSSGANGPAIFGQSSASNEWLICSLRGAAGAGTGLGGMVDYVYGAYPRVFYTNGAERLRIDSSGNVGIGTSSPQAKLHLFTGSNVSVGAKFSNTLGFCDFGIDPLGDGGVYTSTGKVKFLQRGDSNNTSVSFNTTIQNALTLDASGDLSIGKFAAIGASGTLLEQRTFTGTLDGSGNAAIGHGYGSSIVHRLLVSTCYYPGNSFEALPMTFNYCDGGNLVFSGGVAGRSYRATILVAKTSLNPWTN